MNGVLVKLFWLGATNSIELLKKNKRKIWIIGDVLYTRVQQNQLQKVLKLTGTDFPEPMFPVLTDAAVAGFGPESE